VNRTWAKEITYNHAYQVQTEPINFCSNIEGYNLYIFILCLQVCGIYIFEKKKIPHEYRAVSYRVMSDTHIHIHAK
jgi:hypothetical protein